MDQRRKHRDITKYLRDEWNVAKTVLRGKCIAINTYVKKKKKINYLTIYHKILEKRKANEVQGSKRKDIIKIRIETKTLEPTKQKHQ